MFRAILWTHPQIDYLALDGATRYAPFGMVELAENNSQNVIKRGGQEGEKRKGEKLGC